MNLYTSSRLKVLRECLRKHFYRYTLGVQSPSSDAAQFGTVAHAAIEAWLRAWQRGALDERLTLMLATVRNSDLPEQDKARLLALLTAYHFRYQGEPWEIIAIEQEFQYDLEGHIIGGKLDALIRDTRDSRVWVVEHKTTGQDASSGSVYWSRLSIDTQISIYVDGATMLGHEIAGVIYDVLQRPRHELRLATPAQDRKYTEGKGCKKCGGSAKAGSIVRGNGHYTVAFASEVKSIECDGCAGTGWKLDKDGKPEAPRLYANQRGEDETIEEFTDRIIDEIAAEPDAYLIRGVVVRLDDEIPRMRTDLLEAIKLGEAANLFGLHPRNPDACGKFNALCPFFAACSGQADINDEIRFPRGSAHPELSAA